MSTLTIQIQDEQLIQLQAIAQEMNLSSVESLLLKIAAELSELREKNFDEKLQYVLSKNKELYQRLA